MTDIIYSEQYWMYAVVTLATMIQMLPVFHCVIMEYKCRKKKYQAVIVGVFFAAVMSCLSYLPQNAHMMFSVLRFILNFGIIIGWVCYFFEGNTLGKIGFVTAQFVSQAAIDACLGITISNLAGELISVQNGLTWNRTMYALFALPVFMLGSYALYMAWRSAKIKVLRKSMLIYLSLPLFETFIILGVSYHSHITEANYLFAAAIAVVLFIANAAMVFGMAVAIKSVQTATEAAERASMRIVEQRYLDNVQRTYDDIRKLRHDIKNELSAVASMISSENAVGDAIKLIGEIEERYSKSEIQVFCQLPLVNAVMSQKAALCSRNDVRFSVDIAGDAFSENYNNKSGEVIYDFCSALSNILDNASRAAAESTDEKRFVTVEIFRKAECIFIKCRNTVTEEKRELVQSIGDGTGLGTRILEDIASKYDGVYDHSQKENIYTSFIGMRI